MRRSAFTLVEVMIVVLIIGVLLSIAIPQFIVARARSQQRTCQGNLRRMHNAKEIFAMENRLAPGSPVNVSDIVPQFIRGQSLPVCPGGGTYALNVVGTDPSCSVAGGAFSHDIP